MMSTGKKTPSGRRMPPQKNPVNQGIQKDKLTSCQVAITVERSEAKLHSLWNDLDIGQRTVAAWLDGLKEWPNENEMMLFGKKLINKMISRKVVTKEDLRGIHGELDISPKRSCSANCSPNTETSKPDLRRSKSQSRLSRHDKFDQDGDGLKRHIKFDNEDDLKSVLHRENVRLKEENRRLEKRIEHLSKSPTYEQNLEEDFMIQNHENATLRAKINWLSEKVSSLERDKDLLENKISGLDMENRRLRDIDDGISLKMNLDKYRSERNDARARHKKLAAEFQLYKEEVERKIVCMHYEKQKADERPKKYEQDAISLREDVCYLKNKLEETERSMASMKKTAEVLKRTNDNQQQYILELKNSISKEEDMTRDANTAIVQYSAETKKYKAMKEKAKSENLKIKMEKEELKMLVQTLKASAKVEKDKSKNDIDLLNSKIKTLESEKEELIKTLEKQTTQLSSLKNKLNNEKETRDQEDMKRYQLDCLKLKQENEAQENKLAQMKDQYATATREHIKSEQKLRNDMKCYKDERNRLQEKVKSLETDVSSLASKLKEQQVLCNVERESLQSSIKKLKKQLNDAEHYQIEDVSSRTSDYQKQEMDKKNEELVKLTRKMYHAEEELKTCKEQMPILLNECYKLSEDKERLNQQSKSQQDRLKSCEEQITILVNKCDKLSEDKAGLYQQLKSSQDRTPTARRFSDIEKENISLKKELTEAVRSLEGNKNWKDCYDRLQLEIERLNMGEKEKDSLELDNIRLTDQINQLQVQWNKLKADRAQEIGIAEEVMNLKEQKFKLENDKHLMRQEILSLQEKVKSAEEYRHSYEVLKSEIESLKASMRGLKSDNKLLEEKCKSETAARMTRDDISNKYKEDCDRLRKERSAAQHEVVILTREREELANRLRTETESLKLEVDKTKSEKSELGVLYKAQLKKDEEKIRTLEKQNEILKKRTTADSVGQQQAYELLQLKNDYDVCKVQKAQLVEELTDVKMDNIELENKLKLNEIEGKRCESCDELNNKLMRTESELKNVQGRLTREEDRKCQKCDEYERKLSQAKKEYQELQDKFHVAKTNAQNTGRDVHDMREQIESERSNLKSLQRKVEALEREKNVVETALYDKESELSKVRRELTSLDRRITSLQDENADLQRRCKSREEALVKMDLDMRQLKTENGQIKSDMVTLIQDKETLVSKLETERYNKLELEERLRSKSAPVVSDQKPCQNCWKHRNEISEMRREFEDMRDRLSEAVGNKLRDNNPNIADLSDMNRPTSLAEKVSALYTDEYTDAVEAIEELKDLKMDNDKLEQKLQNDISTAACDVSILCDPERPSRLGETFQNVFKGSWCKAFSDLKKKDDDLEVIAYLLDIVQKSYQFEESILSHYKGALDKALVDIAHGKQISNDIQKLNSDHAKKMAKLVADDIHELFISTLGNDCRINSNAVQTYIQEATAICWRFINHEPQLKLFVDPKLDHFDTDVFEEYSKSGMSIAFLVWPMVYFEDDGEKIVISKGIAEGK